MGGGISLMEGVEELMTTTILIGRAISSMTFPGMFRIYDFHSKQAPKLKNARNFTFFANDSEEEDAGDEAQPNPADYEHFFKVVVNGDNIYLEQPLQENEAGWTPLHSCCMSLATVNAGLALIEETVRRGGSLEGKTRHGPGTFNKGWTALQMACAYGIDAIVEKLVACGADVNARNSFGFSCLHEACHRGYADIVKALLRSKEIDLAYLPPEEANFQSPFASAPPQPPLGEAARCGFFRIVQLLLDAGANKNQRNRLGWTPLHEACFYHRIETVKTLLVSGADATLRTNRGALPYHLAGLGEIRTMLKEMGGDRAVPSEEDQIDMVEILTELTMISDNANPQAFEGDGGHIVMSSGSMAMPMIVIAPKQRIEPEKKENKETKQEEEKLLHSGGVLGDLPSLPTKSSPNKSPSFKQPPSFSSPFANPHHAPSLKADEKHKKKSNKHTSSVPPDMPPQYICQLTQRPMSEPMKTIYGNFYDKTAILQWMGTQGRICPLTGAPLSENDLTPLEDLGNEIRQWILKKSLGEADSPVGKGGGASCGAVQGQGDDLYDF